MSTPVGLRALRAGTSASACSKRFYATPNFVQPSAEAPLPLAPRPKPSEKTFFTGRPAYTQRILDLERALGESRAQLRSAYIYPLPSSLPAPQPPRVAWKSAPSLSGVFGTELKTSQYRRVTTLLNELHQLRTVAALAGEPEVTESIDAVLELYERPARAGESDGEKKGDALDNLGRSYSFGRRKESHARAWIIRSPSSLATLDKPAAESSSELPTSEILINSLPLTEHFPRPADRDLILRPFRLTGLLGAFNVFALARGGGTSGQAGAVALAVARGLVIHRPETRDVLEAGEFQRCHSVYHSHPAQMAHS